MYAMHVSENIHQIIVDVTSGCPKRYTETEIETGSVTVTETETGSETETN